MFAVLRLHKKRPKIGLDRAVDKNLVEWRLLRRAFRKLGKDGLNLKASRLDRNSSCNGRSDSSATKHPAAATRIAVLRGHYRERS